MIKGITRRVKSFPLNARERERFDFSVIDNWIKPHERVLDLGCADGRLLKFLKQNKQIAGYGIEISDESVLACIQNGVNVIQIDIEEGLSGFEDNSFDHVILSQSIQVLFSTERILGEMLRVAEEAILSFPNFAFHANREAVMQGYMPVSEDLPFEWYNTPNIRFFTIADFETLCRGMQIEIRECLAFDERGLPVVDDPNLNGSLVFYRLARRKGSAS